MNDTPIETESTKPEVHEFVVRARLPEALHGLEELARNLVWTWSPRATELFRRIDPDAWDAVGHSPLRLLAETSQERLDGLAQDPAFRSELESMLASLAEQRRTAPDVRSGALAYFCAEYGIHESLATYSGGLGVLAGDSLKAASDLCLPFVAVGLLYREGYFQQRLDRDGWQQEEYPAYDRASFPGVRLSDDDGEPLTLELPIGERSVRYHVWRVDVGRVELYLLDTDVYGAPEEDRRITSRLYGGGDRLRLEQEVLLGIGGVRALRRLGIRPAAYHMNEGHSALLTLEQTRQLALEQSLSWDEAGRLAAACNVFTTHTPVAAGHDAFAPALMRRHLEPFAAEYGVDVDELLELGRGPDEADDRFSMTVLGLKMSRYRNGVSRLHGRVSREMWTELWPELSVDDVPIGHVTNGVHVGTWLSPELRALYRQHLGDEWAQMATEHPQGVEWNRVRSIPDAALWETRRSARHSMVHMLRRRLHEEAERRGEPAEDVEEVSRALDPDALTVGFCRRFATYKRATLLFRYLDRLRAILGAEDRPVQFVFAGKAHPKDEPGKRFLQDVVRLSKEEGLRGRVVFVEGYDLELGRALVQGVDVWLNTPRRPYEASGTSGMKAALNGALNLSVLDGWWCEGHRAENGWAFGDLTAADDAAQDEMDAESLYELLENQVVPRFYERDDEGVAPRWTLSMKEALAELSGQFAASRMMRDYEENFYRSARSAEVELSQEDGERLRELIRWWESMQSAWAEVGVESVDADLEQPLEPGAELPVEVRIRSGWIPADQVRVEVLHGPAGPDGIEDPEVTVVPYVDTDDGVHRYRVELRCSRTGRQGLQVRVRPFRGGGDLLQAPTLLRWA